MRENQDSKLYKYLTNDLTNYITKFPEIANKMESYTKANMQLYQYMILNQKTLNIEH